MRFEAVLFDLDGTLTDSAPGILATLHSVLAQYGIDAPEDSLRRYLGPPLRETFGEFLPKCEIERAVEAYRCLYREKGMYQCRVYEGVPEMLQSLRDAGATLCVATSKPRTVAQKVLEHFALTQYFGYIGGASLDKTLDTKTAVMQNVLVQPCVQGKHTVMIGDRFHDLQGAADCGIPAVGVLYGYGDKEELEPFSPLVLASTPAELGRYLLCGKFDSKDELS